MLYRTVSCANNLSLAKPRVRLLLSILLICFRPHELMFHRNDAFACNSHRYGVAGEGPVVLRHFLRFLPRPMLYRTVSYANNLLLAKPRVRLLLSILLICFRPHELMFHRNDAFACNSHRYGVAGEGPVVLRHFLRFLPRPMLYRTVSCANNLSLAKPRVRLLLSIFLIYFRPKGEEWSQRIILLQSGCCCSG